MAVVIKNSQKLMKVDLRGIRRITDDLLASLGLQGRELSLLLVDNRAIAGYNNTFFGKNRPTNVISFGYGQDLPGEILGDIIVSVERAREEADSRGIPFYERLMVLIIHGLLHVLGFHHEQGGLEARRMRYREKALLTHVLSNDLFKKIGL